MTVRTVLVCVRTPLAAQTVAAAATRLGLSGAVRTAVTETEALLRLAERPADIVLADTALTRRDSVGFTRRVLVRAPSAILILFGTEDPRVSAAVIAAGARGVLRSGDHDLVSVVAKALLLCLPDRSSPGGAGRTASAAPAPRETPGPSNGLPAVATTPRPAPSAGPPGPHGPHTPQGPHGPSVVPAQRDQPELSPNRPTVPGPNAGPAWRAGQRNGDRTDAVARRMALTERELQVLRGMADGKSNAEIGRELFVSEDTVKTHARRLFRKLGARDRAHAVAAGFRAGLVA
jgi:DNA-binding NarL/FixJ family response regulator